MIAKHISMRSIRKSRFGELVAYITDAQGKAKRVEQVTIANSRSADVEWAISEVRATQQQKHACRVQQDIPSTHWIRRSGRSSR